MTAGLFSSCRARHAITFQHLAPERYHLPGFSNEVVLGQIGEIGRRTTPVMRTRIYSRDARCRSSGAARR
jgi:hypothetical protein